MLRKAVFVSVVAAFIGYVGWVIFLSALPHDIERDIATRVTSILERSGFTRVIPLVDGRDVALQGEVTSARHAERAERVVSALRGVRSVRSELVVAGPHAVEPNGEGT